MASGAARRLGLRPRRSLGQHFLRDENIARKIARALDVQEGETVLEIGPGAGALTRHLRQRGARLVLVELDPRAVEVLRAEVVGSGVELIEGDILATDLEGIASRCPGGTLRVVDYKSGSTTYSIADITSGHALQAPLYALAAEGLLGEQVVESAYLLIPRREFSGRLSAPAGAAANENIQAALDQAGSFVRDIRQGAFPSLPAKPAAGSLACSAYCEFTSLCRVNRQALAKARRAAG